MSARWIRAAALAALFVAALTSACAPASDRSKGAVKSMQWPIVGGSLDLNAAHEAVIFMEGYDSSGELSYACSGTLISDTVVMTAGHCASEDDSQTAITAPSRYGVFFDTDNDGTPDWPTTPLWLNGTTKPGNVTAVHRHPNYNYDWDNQGAPVNDITVLIISAKPAGVSPIPYLPASLGSNLTDGVSLEFAGYGDQEYPGVDCCDDNDQPRGCQECPMATRFHVSAPLTGSCLATNGCAGGSIGTIPPGTIYYDGDKGPCSGDSGGPAFLTVSGQQYVAGATSYGDSSCQTVGVSTKVDAFDSSFLSQYVTQKGANGSACTATTDCNSGFCVGSVCCGTACGAAPCSTCSTGTCEYTTAACDDGNKCTTNDTCQSGTCAGTAISCSGAGACYSSATCNPSTGLCEGGTAKADGTACNDGNACTTGDVCTGGVCAGTAKVCTPTQPCQVASGCNATTGACTFTAAANGTSCDDGNACTSNDVCKSGACVGTAKTCTPTQACQVASGCDSATGACTFAAAANGTACNDGNACTTGDTCKSGVCSGTAKACTPTQACQVASGCDSATGACTFTTATDGTACNDDNACTTGDSCRSGVCSGTAKVCTPTQACQVAAGCNSQTGACEFSSAADGTSCDDGNACTLNDTCQSGTCAGTAKTCTTTDPCKRSVGCDWQTGECQFGAMPDTTFCDDGDPCTTNDHCQGGTCTGTPGACAADAGTDSASKGACGCGAGGAADTLPALFGLLAWVALARRRVGANGRSSR